MTRLHTLKTAVCGLALSCILAACGGGGGGPPPPPPVPAAVLPTVSAQPMSASVGASASVTFTVVISGGTAPVSFQWKRNGVPIAGATGAAYTVVAASMGDNGASYAVDIINPAGTLASTAAVLTVTVASNDRLYRVNTLADLIDDDTSDGVCHTSANTCSLRAAVMQANHAGNSGVVRIELPAGTYRLTIAPAGTNGEDSGDLNLTAPITPGQSIALVGAGAAGTVIDANGTDRALRIDVLVVASISGVTIRNGHPPAPLSNGGGILNTGNLSLSDSVIEGNRADEKGGGIASPGTLLVLRSTLRSNNASAGGGLWVFGSTTVRDSTVHDNTATLGGGIDNEDKLTVVNSTISRNAASGDGGGIANLAETKLFNVSIIGNAANSDAINGGSGGGVLAAAFLNASVAMWHTLIVGNTSAGSIQDDCAGTLDAYAWTLLGNASGCTVHNPANWGLVTASTIGPLQDNGGPTLTHALLPGSQAIDTTNDSIGCVYPTAFFVPLLTDQRGAPRVAGVRCDVGAFEFGAVVP